MGEILCLSAVTVWEFNLFPHITEFNLHLLRAPNAFRSLLYESEQLHNQRKVHVHVLTATRSPADKHTYSTLTNSLVSANPFSISTNSWQTSRTVIRVSFHTYKLTIYDAYIRKFILSLCFSIKKLMDKRNQILQGKHWSTWLNTIGPGNMFMNIPSTLERNLSIALNPLCFN